MEGLIRELRRPRLTDKLAAGAVAWWLGGLLLFPLVCLLTAFAIEGEKLWPGGAHALSDTFAWLERLPVMGWIVLLCFVMPTSGRLLAALYLRATRKRT